MTYHCITVANIGPVARINHARPAQRNAESMALLDELNTAIEAAVADDDIRVIILGGEGPHFSAGHDLKEAQQNRANFTVEQRFAYEEKRYFDYSMRIWDCPKPTIAQVQGACIAGGFMVANMCDLIVMADDAYFADPVCKTLAAAAVEVLVHPYVMGLRTAKDFLFTGRRMGPEEALRIGMVNRVVARAELEEATLALANNIAEAAPFALKLTKRSLNRAADMGGFRNALTAHFDTHQLSHVSDAFNRQRAKAGLDGAIARARTVA